MNAARRKKLEKVIDQISELQEDLQSLLEEEEEYRDNIPENLQESDRYYKADEACDRLGEAVYELENAAGDIREAIE